MLGLKEWRRAKGLSQQTVADYCQIHVNTYQTWENNPSKIPISAAFKIAKCIGVPFADIDFLAENSTKSVEVTESVK